MFLICLPRMASVAWWISGLRDHPPQRHIPQTLGSLSDLLEEGLDLLSSYDQKLPQLPVVTAQIETLSASVEVTSDRGDRGEGAESLGQSGGRVGKGGRDGLTLFGGSQVFLRMEDSERLIPATGDYR